MHGNYKYKYTTKFCSSLLISHLKRLQSFKCNTEMVVLKLGNEMSRMSQLVWELEDCSQGKRRGGCHEREEELKWLQGEWDEGKTLMVSVRLLCADLNCLFGHFRPRPW